MDALRPRGTRIVQRRLLFFALAFLLGACASIGDAKPPTIQLANLKLGATGLLSQELLIDIRVGNPNDFPLPIDGLTFRLDVNDRYFAEGFSNAQVTVPRLGYATIPVKGTTDLLSILRQIQTLGTRDEIAYRISGVAYVSHMGGRREVPYERKGSLAPLTEPSPGRRDVPRTLVPKTI